MKEIAQQVIDYIKQASPFLWHASYRQAIVDGLADLIGGILFAIAAKYLYRAILYLRRNNSDGWGLAAAGCVVAVCVSVSLLIDAFQILANVDYAAVKELIDLMPGK